MKRVIRSKNRWLLALLVVSAFLTACSSSLQDIPTGNAYVQAKDTYRETTAPTPEIPLAEISNIPADCEIYAQQLSRYYLPLAENWTRDTCAEYSLCPVLLDCVDKDALREIGFACMDLNADGVNELLIGSLDPDDPVILELWAIVNDKPKLLAQAEEQSCYYLRRSLDTDDYIWENRTGVPGSDFAYFYFTFNGSYMEYLWDIFPGISGASQDAMRKAAAQMAGERILPPWTSYASLIPVG